MDYIDNKNILQDFYKVNDLSDSFEKDNNYLESAFNEINEIWFENLNLIDKVNFVMLAEAPLWGQNKNYIYNPKIMNSQFFYLSDLGDIIGRKILNKLDFIKLLNEIGLIVVDISPFTLNPDDTAINYRKMKIKQYKQLIDLTIPFYFEQKIKLISTKLSANCKTFFRYTRVKTTFEDLITSTLLKYKIIKTTNEISNISQRGGGIDKVKFSEILNSNMETQH